MDIETIRKAFDDAQKAINTIRGSIDNLLFDDDLWLAETGAAESQYDVGMRYYTGRGTEKSCEQAFFWFGKAAAQNHPEATFMLGVMHDSGHGTPTDPDAAILMYFKAAKLGSKAARLAIVRGLEHTWCETSPPMLSYEAALEYDEAHAAIEDKHTMEIVQMIEKGGSACV